MNYLSDYYELAMHLVGLDPDDDEQFDDEAEVDDRLYTEYGIETFEQFEKLMSKLMPIIALGKSPLTGTLYKGFAIGHNWLCKVEVKPD